MFIGLKQLILAVLLVSFTSVAAETPSVAADDAGDPLVLRIDSSATCGMSVGIGTNAAIAISQLSGQIEFLDGSGAGISERNGRMHLAASSREIQVTAAGFEGWSARIPKGCSLSLTVCQTKGTLQALTAGANSQDVKVQFSDGATAVLGPASTTQLDLFKDQTYSFSGFGSVSAISADGQVLALSGRSLPLTGGPLREKTDEHGVKRMERLNPITSVKVLNSTNGETRLQIRSEIVTIGKESQIFETPNGSQIELAAGSLNWKVIKGDFRFELEAIPGWKAIGLSGQSGRLSWDSDRRLVDVVNLSKEFPVLVMLTTHTFVRIGEGSTFQFAQVNSLTFATSAVGKNVTLFNARTKQESDLGKGNLLFQGGVAVRANTGIRNTAEIQWDKQSGAIITGTYGSNVVASGSFAILTSKNTGSVQVQFSNGQIIIKSILGEAQVVLTQFERMNVAIAEGDSMSISVDTRRGLFTLHADPDNSFPVRFYTDANLTLMLYANDNATMVGDKIDPYAITEDSLVFYENAGGAGGTSFGYAETQPNFLNINVLTRIQQPPVSVKR
jgi:hypothetical protein